MIDTIHDIQKAYRQLVTAFSFPGTMVTLLPQKRVSDLQTELDDSTLLLALILLDAEVTAYFHETDENEHSLLGQMTSIRFEKSDAADFLFFPRAPSFGFSSSFSHDHTDITKIIGKANRGTAIDPHTGASVLINLPRVPREIGTVKRGWERALRLTGPGIEREKLLACIPSSKGASADEAVPFYHDDFWWVEPRNEKCNEFPLGIELVLYDDDYNVCAIPRSTKVEVVSSEEFN